MSQDQCEIASGKPSEAQAVDRRLDSLVRCSECGGKVCVCECDGMWAAHCMDCENQIGQRGFYDPCALTKEEAERRWNKMNTPNPTGQAAATKTEG